MDKCAGSRCTACAWNLKAAYEAAKDLANVELSIVDADLRVVTAAHEQMGHFEAS